MNAAELEDLIRKSGLTQNDLHYLAAHSKPKRAIQNHIALDRIRRASTSVSQSFDRKKRHMDLWIFYDSIQPGEEYSHLVTQYIKLLVFLEEEVSIYEILQAMLEPKRSYYRVICLYYGLGEGKRMQIEEIADYLEVKPATVRHNLERGRKRVHDWLLHMTDFYREGYFEELIAMDFAIPEWVEYMKGMMSSPTFKPGETQVIDFYGTTPSRRKLKQSA